LGNEWAGVWVRDYRGWIRGLFGDWQAAAESVAANDCYEERGSVENHFDEIEASGSG
jgi:hypothetical protein